LKEVASKTDGRYFRATNNDELKEIYETIDKLEKSKIDEYVFENKHDEYMKFALIAFAFFFLDMFLRLTIFRTKP
jgi:Ca-activated chloride channel family protein